MVFNDPTAPLKPIMLRRQIGKVLCFFRVQLPPKPGEAPSARDYGKFAAIRPCEQIDMEPRQQARSMPRFRWHRTSSIKVIRIGSIESTASMVPILPSLWNGGRSLPETAEELWAAADRFLFNTKVDLWTYSKYY